VAIEGSRDGSAAGMVPLCTPVSTSGLTTIKIQMLRDEIVTAVLIRLHKPRDSQTIGLSHIMLMGYMAFSDMSGSAASRIANVHTPMEDYVSRTRSVDANWYFWRIACLFIVDKRFSFQTAFLSVMFQSTVCDVQLV
jgi:hypothetical protein